MMVNPLGVAGDIIGIYCNCSWRSEKGQSPGQVMVGAYQCI